MIDRRQLVAPGGASAGDHYIQAERSPRAGKEVLHAGLTRTGVGETRGGERGRVTMPNCCCGTAHAYVLLIGWH